LNDRHGIVDDRERDHQTDPETNQVFPAESLKAETEKLVSRLAAGPTRAFGGAKLLLMTAPNSSLESQMEQETRQIVEMSMSQDGREGVSAFSEKRKPIFTGH
jgi:2-(1,2-epoxy-1,2-dihydrophenyl)acetyl-CoA isomerase